MAMQPMTRLTVQVEALDRELHLLRVQIHDHTWNPEELGCIRDEIDALLDKRGALTSSVNTGAPASTTGAQNLAPPCGRVAGDG